MSSRKRTEVNSGRTRFYKYLKKCDIKIKETKKANKHKRKKNKETRVYSRKI